jgi:hypothetical protein
MVRKAWIAFLIFALCLHVGAAAAAAYGTLCSPEPFRFRVVWGIVFVNILFAAADCIALHRRIIDDNDGTLRLGL